MGSRPVFDTDRWEGFMKYAIELAIFTMISVPSFVKFYSGIKKLIQ
jgi:hypothetical protein